MAQDLKALQKLFNQALKVMPDKLPRIVEVEGLSFIKGNFKKQGFQTGGSVQKWKKRKTRDRKNRDLTRYRTDRVGTKGSLNRFGSKNKGRAVLIGFNTGGDKLSNSFKTNRSTTQVRFITYKDYAQRHNEGLAGMPKRQYMGKSKTLNTAIEKKLTRELDKLFKK